MQKCAVTQQPRSYVIFARLIASGLSLRGTIAARVFKGDSISRKRFSGDVFNRRSRVRAVVTRGSTGLVGQNTSCKVHKVCISLWPTGWDNVKTRAESPF